MGFHIIAFVLTIILFGTLTDRANGECLEDYQIAACDAVFNPETMEEICCTTMEVYIGIHQECMELHATDEFTCYVSRCVIGKYRFGKTTVIEDESVKARFRESNKKNPDTIPLTNAIEENCLDDQYFNYGANETYCNYNMFEVCVNVNALMACQKFVPSRRCEMLAVNAAICKPVLEDYLDYINENSLC